MGDTVLSGVSDGEGEPFSLPFSGEDGRLPFDGDGVLSGDFVGVEAPLSARPVFEGELILSGLLGGGDRSFSGETLVLAAFDGLGDLLGEWCLLVASLTCTSVTVESVKVTSESGRVDGHSVDSVTRPSWMASSRGMVFSLSGSW